MFRVIKASAGSPKVTGRTWPEFCENIKSEFGYDVDSAYRRRYDKWIILLKDGKEYDAEVTKYSDGTYELMKYNITEVR